MKLVGHPGPHMRAAAIYFRRLTAVPPTLLLCAAAITAAACKPYAAPQTRSEPAVEDPAGPSASKRPHPDLTGRTRYGMASFYAKKFADRIMADGTPMDPHGDNAASRTLPLGTTARVTNTETGLSAQVTIRDRGPYAGGRIVDLSPSTARQIGLTARQGIAPVAVAPISVVLPNGATRAGTARVDANR